MQRHWGIMGICLIGLGACLSSIMGRTLQAKGEILWNATASVSEEQRTSVRVQAMNLFNQAKQWEPTNPRHAYYTGLLHENAARAVGVGTPAAAPFLTLARDAYLGALSLEPLHADYHLALAGTESLRGEAEAARQAVARALQVYPLSPWVQTQALSVSLTNWKALSRGDKESVKKLVAQQAARSREETFQLVWSSVSDTQDIREILPLDPAIRNLLLTYLTEQQYILDRWAELDASRSNAPIPDSGDSAARKIEVISQGILELDQPHARLAVDTRIPWEGLVAGWVSGVRPATTDLELPPGEALVCVSLRGVKVDGIWPNVDLKIGGQLVARWTVTNDNAMQPWFVLLKTAGGTFPVEVVVTNGQVAYRNNQFIERRVAIGPLKLLTPTLSQTMRDRSTDS